MMSSIVLTKTMLKSATGSSSFSTNLPLLIPLHLVDMKSLEFVILLEKKGLAASKKFLLVVT